MTSYSLNPNRSISRRVILKDIAIAPLLLRAAPLFGLSSLGTSPQPAADFTDFRLTPHYPSPSPLADVLALVAPGSDAYVTEKHALEIEAILGRWGQELKSSPRAHSALAPALDAGIQACSLVPAGKSALRSAYGIEIEKRQFASELIAGRDRFIENIGKWLGEVLRVETAEFEIYGIQQSNHSRVTVLADIRYDLVMEPASSREERSREERLGSWHIEWIRDESGAWRAVKWQAGEETICRASASVFVDITAHALAGVQSYRSQLLHGADYWRTVLDGAVGVDVYGNNGVAAGDYDGDGFDDLYICQPAGLPNRLYRNRGDGTFEDVTEKAGVGVLDGTACALFADFRNRGRQDLLVVCGTGPLLFVNQGDGTFSLRREAFKFARPPLGTFTHAALADYDGDGRLDIYFCTYMYYLGLDQYHYPIPYYDARNGPPNCIFHNEGDGTFIETTDRAGLNADNNRYSFACAWGDSNGNGLPDLFVANDFGSSQLYRNNGDGTFKVVSKEARVESVGAGMSCCWADYDNDGHQDIYVPSMWEAAGQRVSGQQQFHEKAPETIRALYQRHARGNALYRNAGDGTFQNLGHEAGVEMGRWSWCSDFWDFDHDGYADLYVANGYLSGPDRNDLASFFWRQVVAKSPEDAIASAAYERGWNAINELVRSDRTWHGYARNVMFLNNHDGTFTEASGALGLDFLEDSRSFALADIDGDGRLEVILKNRNAPQLRIIHNAMTEIGGAISFRLRGTKSNRDAIGAAITVEAGPTKQTRYLQAGSGFLAQHAKELFFGLGNHEGNIRTTVRWPSGLAQTFEQLPANHCVEIEEGVSKFAARPFAMPPRTPADAAPVQASDDLPDNVETWLIEPLKAPEFSLPDLSGKQRDVASLRGNSAALIFWSSSAPQSLELLKRLQHREPDSGLCILAINVDEPAAVEQARTLAAQPQFSFPCVFATTQVAGVYNLIYRHLFDRRRDLPIPLSFLLDRNGMIVKAYQGMFDSGRLHADARSIPANAKDRMARALPFPGMRVQSSFERNDFTYGVAMYQHGYLEHAAESFQQVIAAKPGNADAYYNLGTLKLRSNNFDEARSYLEKTLKLQPNYPEAWNNLGMLAAQQGRPDEAINDFQQSLELRPQYATAHLNLGNVYRRQKLFDQARESLTRALELQPDDPETNYSLGMLYAQQDQMRPASDYLQRAIELRPNYAEAFNNLGIVFVRLQDFSRAEEQFKSGIRAAPNFDQTYLNLAGLYAMRSDKDKARGVLEDLLRRQPDNRGAKQALELLQ
ncbi:MAG TPA: tetratricopeptide repeat protein [Terracidiphilus sp.]|jgi:tetratricopeptide (TPR) repeat protein